MGLVARQNALDDDIDISNVDLAVIVCVIDNYIDCSREDDVDDIVQVSDVHLAVGIDVTNLNTQSCIIQVLELFPTGGLLVGVFGATGHIKCGLCLGFVIIE